MRDATAPALAALVRDAGGEPGRCAASSPTTATRSTARAARRGRARATSSSSRRARPSARATRPPPSSPDSARPGSGRTASRCGRASRRCWPSAAACPSSACPATRARRSSCSGWSGMPVVRLVGGMTDPPAGRRPCAPGWRATCRPPPDGSTSCRSRCATAWRRRCSAPRRCYRSSTAADGYVVVPDDATGLHGGTEVDVTLYLGWLSRLSPWPRRRSSATSRPPRRSPPGARPAPPPAAPTASRPCVSGCTRPSAASRPSRSGRRARRRRSTPRPWTASRCAQRTPSARARARRSCVGPGDFVVVDTGDPLPEGFDAVVMREHVHLDDDGRAELRGAVAPYQHVRIDRRGRQRHRAAAARRAIGCGRSTSPPPQPPARRTCSSAARPVVAVLPTGDEIRPVGTEPAPGVILDTNSLMLAGAGRGGGLRGLARREIVPDDPERDRRRRARRRGARRPRRSSSPARAPGATTTPRPSSRGWARSPCTASRCVPGHPGRARRGRRRRRCSARRATRSRPR